MASEALPDPAQGRVALRAVPIDPTLPRVKGVFDPTFYGGHLSKKVPTR
jgi:hypothetical protein